GAWDDQQGDRRTCSSKRACDTVKAMASSADRAPTTRVPAIIVHGGAGADSSQAPEFRQGVRAAVLAGWRVLAEGGTALDAVESAVRALEDDPRFNPGPGPGPHPSGTNGE